MPQHPFDPSVVMSLGGRERRLVFNLNTYADYEAATGRFFFDTMGKLVQALDEVIPASDNGKPPEVQPGMVLRLLSRISVVDLRAILWAAVKQSEPGLRVEEVGDWVDHRNLVSLLTGLLMGEAQTRPTEEEMKEALPVMSVEVAPLEDRGRPFDPTAGGETSGL